MTEENIKDIQESEVQNTFNEEDLSVLLADAELVEIKEEVSDNGNENE